MELAPFGVLISHMWLLATLLLSVDISIIAGRSLGWYFSGLRRGESNASPIH